MRTRWPLLAALPMAAGLGLAVYGSVLRVQESAARMQ